MIICNITWRFSRLFKKTGDEAIANENSPPLEGCPKDGVVVPFGYAQGTCSMVIERSDALNLPKCRNDLRHDNDGGDFCFCRAIYSKVLKVSSLANFFLIRYRTVCTLVGSILKSRQMSFTSISAAKQMIYFISVAVMGTLDI